MRLALAQYGLDAEVESNLARALDFVCRAGNAAADLILFPELCFSPFFPQFAGRDATRYAMQLDDECIQQIRSACRRLQIAASPNVYLRENERLFDASLMIERDGKILGVSKMVHIAQMPCFYEQDYYDPSDTGFKVYDTASGKIGIVVCFDRHYPESIRTCVLGGASLILIATANTMDEPRDLFECELRAAALQNGVFIAMCNRTGAEGGVVFCGESIVVGPDGELVAKAPTAKEALLIADLDLADIARARERRPFLSLRRPETFS
jgi:predicted amidohydrolase